MTVSDHSSSGVGSIPRLDYLTLGGTVYRAPSTGWALTEGYGSDWPFSLCQQRPRAER